VLQEFSVTCRKDKWFVDERPEAHGLCLNGHDAIADTIDAAERFAKSRKRFDVLLKLSGSSAELPWNSKAYLADCTANRLAGMEQPRKQENVEKRTCTHRQASLALIQLLSSASL
jgi:hypothetical protein